MKEYAHNQIYLSLSLINTQKPTLTRRPLSLSLSLSPVNALTLFRMASFDQLELKSYWSEKTKNFFVHLPYEYFLELHSFNRPLQNLVQLAFFYHLKINIIHGHCLALENVQSHHFPLFKGCSLICPILDEATR